MTITSSMTITKSNPNGAAPPEVVEEPAKKGWLLKLLILVVAVAALGYLAYAMFLGPMLYPPHYAVGQPVPLGTTLDLEAGNSAVNSGPPAFNLADNGHVVSLDPVLQLTSVANSTTMNNDVPQFLNAVVSVLNTTTQANITGQLPVTASFVGCSLPTAGCYINGEHATQARILAAIQKIAGTVDGHAPQVVAVYFTGFVTQ